MIFADKILMLRKKNGWSQEELASRLNVSRQAVAKWEAAQSVPSLEKILSLSEVFGVTTDYLLKDDMEQTTYAEEKENIRTVSLTEAQEYLEQRKTIALNTAAGAFLCVLSPVPLLVLGAVSTYHRLPISENMAGGIGLCLLFVLIALAVILFLRSDMLEKPWKFLDTGEFVPGYGVRGMVEQQQMLFSKTDRTCTVLGCVLYILSPVPIFLSLIQPNEFLIALSVSVLLMIVSVAAPILIWDAEIKKGYEKLLQEGDYTPENRRSEEVLDPASGIYWLCATAIYLAWSFATGDWQKTWIVWPVAGVLFAAFMAFMKMYITHKEQKK